MVRKTQVRAAAMDIEMIAEKLGRRMAANIVVLGFLTGWTQIVSRQAMEKAVESSVPTVTEAFNLSALERGLARAEEALKATTSS